MYSLVHYSANYGFVPQMFCEDENPALNILVLCSAENDPVGIIEPKIAGLLRIVGDDAQDDKIFSIDRTLYR
ncbi:MAG: inorganic diphosphatase [Bacteroidota bacterium]|jgi:inorganic pyrophosphatase